MDDSAFKQYLEYNLHRLAEDENAFFNLIEAGEQILPWLENRFATEFDPERRRAITEVIWQSRKPSSVAFLARALTDGAEVVWKEALEGLVAIGGRTSVEVLRSALREADPVKQDWINEASDQIAARG